MTGVLELKALEKARDKLVSLQKESDPNTSALQHQVLQQQLIELQIQQKKRMIASKKHQRKAARSHRQDIPYAFKAFKEPVKMASTNNQLEMTDGKASGSSSLVAEKSELQNHNPMFSSSQKFGVNREGSAGGDSSENIAYLATDPAL